MANKTVTKGIVTKTLPPYFFKAVTAMMIIGILLFVFFSLQESDSGNNKEEIKTETPKKTTEMSGIKTANLGFITNENYNEKLGHTLNTIKEGEVYEFTGDFYGNGKEVSGVVLCTNMETLQNYEGFAFSFKGKEATVKLENGQVTGIYGKDKNLDVTEYSPEYGGNYGEKIRIMLLESQ